MELGVMQRLRLLRQFEGEGKLQTHNVLNIFRAEDRLPRLDVLNRPGFTGDLSVLLKRLYRVCSSLHRTPAQLQLV